MSQNFPHASGSILPRLHYMKYLFLILALVGVVLTTSFNFQGASAEIEPYDDLNKSQDASNANYGDFVIAFMDSPTGSYLGFDITASGLYDDSSRRFSDIPVNTATDGPQLNQDIAMASNGDFVVVWADDQDKNDYYQIHARGFYSDGSQRFPTFTVNTVAAGNQTAPAIAMAPNGEFVVTWQDDQDNNGVSQIHARGFNSDGSQRFSTITVNSSNRGDQINPNIAMASNGDFIVTWQDDPNLDDLYNVLARRFDSSGSGQSITYTGNQDPAGDHRFPDVAMDSLGHYFVLTWQDDTDNNGVYQIHARSNLYFSTITVNSVNTGNQTEPHIAMDNFGNFVISWTDDQDQNGVNQILARGFDKYGLERIPDFTVNSVSTGEQIVSDIAMDAIGNFVVAWQDDQDQNGVFQIMARGFYSDGSERFSDFTVNQVNTGEQWYPTIAMVRNVPSVYIPVVMR